ncbi:ABC transporter substrate-binding protein [Paenibacillus agaridevorans]|uniref:ABC transporter substrate-binding protein n=1 Tax=Paenibacillus agaridevorans TaxID=171404 RepID=UPI001BE48843|nr:ABC transporter substrate-binding protein [Paenibacillus agaridevorans]
MAIKKVGMAALLAFAVFGASACSGNNVTNEVKPADSTAPAQNTEAPKTLEISWMGQGARGKVEDNNKVQQMIEQKFNVKLLNRKIDANNNEQRNLMVASGELPDIAFMATPVKLYEDAATRSIPKAMIEEHAPNYAKMLDSQPTGWKVNQIDGKDGEFYALTGYKEEWDNLIWGQVYRLDWMEKLGIEPKGELVPLGTSGGLERIFFSKESFTLDEELKMFEQFVQDDPDDNGKKDTHGLLMNNSDASWALNTVAGAFGFGWDYNLEENGKVTGYAISDNYKKFLKYLAQLYQQGLIDPEFTTLNRAKSWEKFAAGKYGAAQVQIQAAGLMPFTFNRPPGNLVQNDSNAKFLFTPPPIGFEGQQGSAAYTPVDGFGYAMVIKKDVTDEKLARILQIFDYINFDQEGLMLSQFGEEGIDYTWEGEAYRSAVIPIESAEADREKHGIGYYNLSIQHGDVAAYYANEGVSKLTEMFFGADEGRNMAYRPYKWDYFNETKYNDLNTTYGAQLKTITDEFLFKSITGEVDVDSNWDSYVTKWLNSGGSELLAELEKAPKVADLRKN